MARRAPLHQEVVQQLRSLIESDAFGAEGRLPSEAELTHRLGVSRATVREALRVLEAEGAIVRQHGVGTFVHKRVHRIQAGIDRLEGFVETIRRAGYTPRVEHLTARCQPMSQAAARALGMEPGTPAVYVDNLFFANDRPIVYSPSEFPAERFGPLENFTARPWNSAQEYLASQGKGAAFASLSLLALPATPEIAARLQVARGFPLLLLEGLSFTGRGEPVGWNRAYFNTHIFHFTIARR